MTNCVLITGATGLIGRRITELLLQKGCRVSHLGRSARKGPVPSYRWDPKQGTIDATAFDGIDTVIHLAGAGIADKRWNKARKREILNSRIQSTTLLHHFLKSNANNVHTIVCASAIGYYGFGLEDTVLSEDSSPGSDFLASVVVQWEKAMDAIGLLGLRLVKIRIGIVLSREGGALKELARPIGWGIGAPLGSGRQMMSWIHIDDLCEMFVKGMTDTSARGAYNATAPHPVTNRELTKAIARVLGRPIILPSIPAFIITIAIGEMADLVLYGSNVSSKKIMDAGYIFLHPELTGALQNLLVR